MAAALNIPAPRKAEKRRVKLKLALQGPSGSGKTWGALALAKNLWPNAKVCLIDTENESASLYADSFDFDTIPLHPPFHTDRYAACVDAVVSGGYDVCIIDSLSHQWDGEGGILRRKEELDQRPGANSYTNWSKFTPEHTRFKEMLVQAPLHVIATMRSKQDYILETNDKGKQQPRKVGMAPIQRDGFDYEFSLVFDVQMDHRAQVDKNRTGLFDGEVINLADPKVAAQLAGWLSKGVEAPTTPAPTEINRPQPTKAPAQTASRPPDDIANYQWHYRDGELACHPLSMRKGKTKKGEEYITVKLNRKLEDDISAASCFHASLFPAIEASIMKPSTFRVAESGGYLNITDVLMVGDVEYREGKPLEPTGKDPVDETFITDDDIPF